MDEGLVRFGLTAFVTLLLVVDLPGVVPVMSHLRLQGVGDIARVREACLEADGRISVVSDDAGAEGAPEPVAKVPRLKSPSSSPAGY